MLGIITGTASFLLILTAIQHLAARKFPKGICPVCDGELKAVGGGFSDGGTHTKWELLTYALTLLIVYGAGVLLKSLYERTFYSQFEAAGEHRSSHSGGSRSSFDRLLSIGILA